MWSATHPPGEPQQDWPWCSRYFTGLQYFLILNAPTAHHLYLSSSLPAFERDFWIPKTTICNDKDVFQYKLFSNLVQHSFVWKERFSVDSPHWKEKGNPFFKWGEMKSFSCGASAKTNVQEMEYHENYTLTQTSPPGQVWWSLSYGRALSSIQGMYYTSWVSQQQLEHRLIFWQKFTKSSSLGGGACF